RECRCAAPTSRRRVRESTHGAAAANLPAHRAPRGRWCRRPAAAARRPTAQSRAPARSADRRRLSASLDAYLAASCDAPCLELRWCPAFLSAIAQSAKAEAGRVGEDADLGGNRAPFAGVNRIRFQGSGLNRALRDTPGGSLTIAVFAETRLRQVTISCERRIAPVRPWRGTGGFFRCSRHREAASKACFTRGNYRALEPLS